MNATVVHVAHTVSIRAENGNPWVPASELRRIVRDAPADAGLLDDLAEVRNAELDD
jgi:hypothetical protein